MLIPSYWAEASVKARRENRQMTIRRFGWSELNQEEAQHHAESRAQEALERLMAGEKLERREPKVAYNGAQGVPIREEVLSRHSDAVITRNLYGARCLNTPNVLFADIDFVVPSKPKLFYWSVFSLSCLCSLLHTTLWGWDWLAYSRLPLGFSVIIWVLGYGLNISRLNRAPSKARCSVLILFWINILNGTCASIARQQAYAY